MSFKSLVNKLMKEGKSKEAATKIAGKVASEKMKGAKTHQFWIVNKQLR